VRPGCSPSETAGESKHLTVVDKPMNYPWQILTLSRPILNRLVRVQTKDYI